MTSRLLPSADCYYNLAGPSSTNSPHFYPHSVAVLLMDMHFTLHALHLQVCCQLALVHVVAGASEMLVRMLLSGFLCGPGAALGLPWRRSVGEPSLPRDVNRHYCHTHKIVKYLVPFGVSKLHRSVARVSARNGSGLTGSGSAITPKASGMSQAPDNL